MFPFPLAAHDGFKRLSVPFACLRYGNPWNLILLFSLQGVLFINIAQAFILHQSICFDSSSRIACYKSSWCSLPFLLRSNFKSVGFGSDVLWGCYCIHRRHPVSFVLPNQALFWKGIDLFHFGSFPYDFDLRRLTFFGLIFSINILIYTLYVRLTFSSRLSLTLPLS